MPEESPTIDLVSVGREAREAMSRGDLDAVMSLFAPDAVYDLSEAGLGAFEGKAAIRRFFEDWHRSWEDYRFQEEEILDFGHGVGLNVVRESARLAGGTGRVELLAAQVVLTVNGKIQLLKAYAGADEARAAAQRFAQERA